MLGSPALSAKMATECCVASLFLGAMAGDAFVSGVCRVGPPTVRPLLPWEATRLAALLVEDPGQVLPLMSRMEPLVVSATEKIADPESRGVAERAHKTLQKAAGDDNAAESKILVTKDALAIFKTALGDKASGEEFDTVGLHFAGFAAAATNIRKFDAAMWKSELGLGPFASVTEDIRVKIEVASKPAEEIEEKDTEGVDLYKGSFSLAYGKLALLRVTKMYLKRNRFHVLLGSNQCGKTTLMRAIVNDEGFPKQDELKSVFVEHEFEDEEVGVQDDGFPILCVDKPGWSWVMHTCNEIYKLETPVTEEQCKELMKSTGFGYPGGPDRAANLEMPVTSYSGGWKMKVQLCAAQLTNCDVLMLDEPTGHLDVDNIKRLEDRKLKTFKRVKGNTLTMFVKSTRGEGVLRAEQRDDEVRLPGARSSVRPLLPWEATGLAALLVEDPAEVLPLMSRLEPLVKSATEKIADPEARGVAQKAVRRCRMRTYE